MRPYYQDDAVTIEEPSEASAAFAGGAVPRPRLGSAPGKHTPVREFGRQVAYSGWPTDKLCAALVAMEARRRGASRDDFGVIAVAAKMRYELQRREREALRKPSCVAVEWLARQEGVWPLNPGESGSTPSPGEMK